MRRSRRAARCASSGAERKPLDRLRARCHSWCMVTQDDVRSACLALPHTSERLSWNRPAWFARTLFARLWDDTALTVKTSERDALLATQPDVFFSHPHHRQYPSLLLVRLGRIDGDELMELIDDSYRIANGSAH